MVKFATRTSTTTTSQMYLCGSLLVLVGVCCPDDATSPIALFACGNGANYDAILVLCKGKEIDDGPAIEGTGIQLDVVCHLTWTS